MKKNKHLKVIHDSSFKNTFQKNMNFEDVFEHILSFMKEDPMAKYHLMLVTDSQVHKRHTRFVTGIIIHREGKGAWGCLRETSYPRKITNLHEKISIETSLTEEVAYMFTSEMKDQMVSIVLPHIYKGSAFTIEGHIDVGDGKHNDTRVYVREMVGRIKNAGLEPMIKSQSQLAIGYANRYTK